MALPVHNPYRLDVTAEIRRFSGAADVHEFTARVRDHIANAYDLTDATVVACHVGGAFAVTLSAGGRPLVAKLNEYGIDDPLDPLLTRVERLHAAGLPLPRLHRTVDGRRHTSPFGTGADQAYLLDLVPGAPTPAWSARHADATADLLSRLHELGRAEPVQPGERLPLSSCWPDLHTATTQLADTGALTGAALAAARQVLDDGPPQGDLVETHVHGDARLCHVLFTGDRITGLVDLDDGMWGQRIVDIAFHLISHPDPSRTGFLNTAAVADWLRRYHDRSPFTPDEVSALPAALTCALLVELGQLVNVDPDETGRTDLMTAARLLPRLVDGPAIRHALTPAMKW